VDELISPPDLPRVALLDGPTPLHPMPRLSEALGGRVELWIKREDLGPISFSGNKLRNLEFLLGAAVAEGAKAIVTSGRRWSNHCRLTAAAGSRLGLEVHTVLSGPATRSSTNVRLIELFGGVVHQAETADRQERAALVERVAADLRTSGHEVKVIAVGGSDPTGAWGQVLAGFEVARQATALGFEPNAIVLPTATGGTQAGLLTAFAADATRPPRIIGLVVAHTADELRTTVQHLATELAAMAGRDAPLPPVELDESQLGDGYGIATPSSAGAARLLARTDGILVDPIYGAKALAGLIELVRSGALDGRHAIFWHGGGLPAVFDGDTD
jgi:1-aminocyclopropane-1-carboxylate deaminase/D-cysteine desulfhydrase-like pyridoxal-dependent ACC family enzyme